MHSGYNSNGNFYSPSNMQSQGTYIELTARNQVTVTSEDFYILFFGFPLRNNGIITNGCKTPGGTTYGNAYYHQNLWIIICDFTVNNMGTPAGSGVVSRTLRI